MSETELKTAADLHYALGSVVAVIKFANEIPHEEYRNKLLSWVPQAHRDLYGCLAEVEAGQAARAA